MTQVEVQDAWGGPSGRRKELVIVLVPKHGAPGWLAKGAWVITTDPELALRSDDPEFLAQAMIRATQQMQGLHSVTAEEVP